MSGLRLDDKLKALAPQWQHVRDSQSVTETSTGPPEITMSALGVPFIVFCHTAHRCGQAAQYCFYVSFTVSCIHATIWLFCKPSPEPVMKESTSSICQVESSVIQHALGKVVSLFLPSTSAITGIRRIAPSANATS